MGVRPMGRGKSAMWMAGLGGPPNGGHRGLAPAGGIVHAGCAAPGGKEKMSRRVGLRRRRPPAAGGGWLALPCRSRGRKRTALGESLGPGRFRDTPASLSAAAHASAENQPARSDAERAKREAGQMRSCTPTTSAPSATGRQLQTCRREKRARRQAKIGACTDPPTPVARRRERAGAPLHRSASKRPFLLDRARPVFFSARPKRKWGVHCPAIIIAAIPRPMGRTPNTPAPEHRICPVAYTIPR